MMRAKDQGKKRHVLVDTLGLLLHAIVHPADIQDRDGGILLLATLFGMYPFLQTLFADAGYQGRQFHDALKKILPHLRTQIVKRSDQAKGLWCCPSAGSLSDAGVAQPLPQLTKDWENLNRTALAFSPRLNPLMLQNFVILTDVSGQTLSLGNGAVCEFEN